MQEALRRICGLLLYVISVWVLKSISRNLCLSVFICVYLCSSDANDDHKMLQCENNSRKCLAKNPTTEPSVAYLPHSPFLPLSTLSPPPSPSPPPGGSGWVPLALLWGSPHCSISTGQWFGITGSAAQKQHRHLLWDTCRVDHRCPGLLHVQLPM